MKSSLRVNGGEVSMSGIEVFEKVVTVIYDLLEECIGTMVIVKGKRLFEVWLVTAIIFVLVLVCHLLKYPTFISWKESLFAVAVMGFITVSNSVNKTAVTKVLSKLRKVNK